MTIFAIAIAITIVSVFVDMLFVTGLVGQDVQAYRKVKGIA